jgi:hypothetical protein
LKPAVAGSFRFSWAAMANPTALIATTAINKQHQARIEIHRLGVDGAEYPSMTLLGLQI